LVDRAAPSGVVPGKLGNAAVLGAGSGFAEGAHHRSGANGAASAIASQHGHAWIVPPPKQGKHCSASPYPPVGSEWSRRVGCRLPGSSTHVVLVAVVGLGWLGVTELLARVGGSSVTANWPCADQGGRHVDVVVGADHRGRAGVGVWRDAATGPLTALRQRPDHGRHSCWTRPTAWRRGQWVHTQRAQPTTQRCSARGLGCAAGVGASGARPPRTVLCWKATPFGLVHDGDGGLSVGLAGGGGHYQPQPSCGSWDRGDARLAPAGTTGSAQARHRLIRDDGAVRTSSL